MMKMLRDLVPRNAATIRIRRSKYDGQHHCQQGNQNEGPQHRVKSLRNDYFYDFSKQHRNALMIVSF